MLKKEYVNQMIPIVIHMQTTATVKNVWKVMLSLMTGTAIFEIYTAWDSIWLATVYLVTQTTTSTSIRHAQWDFKDAEHTMVEFALSAKIDTIFGMIFADRSERDAQLTLKTNVHRV